MSRTEGPRRAQRSRRAQLFVKRCVDVVLASVTLVVLSPLFAAVAILIRATMGSPILFRQQRAGYRGRPFVLLKFRTMTYETDAGEMLLPDAQRLTRLGRLLRATSFDELPELINVLRGEMSLVGPRPLLTEYLDLYTSEQHRRHEMRPGITGAVQVRGRNLLSWEEKFAWDVWYVDNWSLLLDLKLLLLTAWKVVSREGISAQEHATMPKFQGSRVPPGDGRQ